MEVMLIIRIVTSDWIRQWSCYCLLMYYHGNTMLTVQSCIAEYFLKSKTPSPLETEGGPCRFSRNVATGIGGCFYLVCWGFLGLERTAFLT